MEGRIMHGDSRLGGITVDDYARGYKDGCDGGIEKTNRLLKAEAERDQFKALYEHGGRERDIQAGIVQRMEEEIDVLIRRKDAIKKEREDLKRANELLSLRISQIEDEIDRAMNELGVPVPGYPAPVSNAYFILEAALALAKEVA